MTLQKLPNSPRYAPHAICGVLRSTLVTAGGRDPAGFAVTLNLHPLFVQPGKDIICDFFPTLLSDDEMGSSRKLLEVSC